MLNNFTFAGKNSRDFGMYITGNTVYDAAERDVEIIDVPGRSEELEIDMGRYKNVPIGYDFFVRDRLAERSKNIKAWLLSQVGYTVLQDTYDKDYYRRARFSGPVNFEATLHKFGKAELVFSAGAFKYSHAGNHAQVVKKSGTNIVNLELFPSRPYFKVYGSGAGNFYFNNTTIQLLDIDDYIEIDTELYQVFKGRESRTDKIILGNWPLFLPGENLIQWDGGIAKIEYVPRWCTL